MKRFSSISAREVLLALALTVFCMVTVKAEGEQYYKAYNQIRDAIGERGEDIVGIPVKAMGNSVTQNDLNKLRKKIAGMCSKFIIYEQMIDIYAADPFEFVQINNGNGFTKVPIEYTDYPNDESKTIYSNDFTDIPILWVHFQEMAEVLNIMTSRLCDTTVDKYVSRSVAISSYPPPGYTLWDVPYSPAMKVTGTSFANIAKNWHYIVPPFPGIQRFEQEDYYGYIKIIELPSAPAYVPEREDTLDFYYAAKRTVYTGYFTNPQAVKFFWKDAESPSIGDTFDFIRPELVPMPEPNGSENVIPAKQFYVVTYSPETIVVANPGQGPDSNQNDLTKPGCLPCIAKGIEEYFDEKGIDATYPLGVSDGSGGLMAFAYIQNYSFAGINKKHFSLDTNLSIFPGSQNVSGTTVHWRFTQVQRPKGANTLMVWTDWANGTPNRSVGVEGVADYNLIKLENQGGSSVQYEIKFADDITHVFNSGGSFVKAYKIEDGERLEAVPPFSGLTVSRIGDKILQVTSPLGVMTPIWTYVQLYAVNLPGLFNPNDLCLSPSIAGQVLSSSLLGVDPPPGSVEVITGIERKFPDGSPMGDISFGRTISAGTNGGTEVTETTTITDSSNAITDKTETKFLEDSATESNISEHRIYTISNGAPGAVAKLTRYATQPITTAGIRDVKESITADGNTAVTLRRYKTFPWNEEVIEEITAYGTSAERTAEFDYYTSSGTVYGKMKYQKNPDGSWIYYIYDAQGRVSKEITPFGNNALGTEAPSESANRVTEYSYEPLETGDVAYPGDSRTRRVIRKALGAEVAREYNIYLPNEFHHIVCRTPGAAYDASSNLTTVYYSYTSGDFSGRQSKIVNANGTKEIYSYSRDGSGNLSTTVDKGYGSGNTVTSGVRTVTVVNTAGNTTSSSVTDIASGLTLSSETYVLDGFGQTIQTNYLGGTSSSTEYGCCGPTEQVAPDGSVTTMAYNALKQLDHQAAAGITTFYTYDERGNTVSTTVKGTDNSEKTTTNAYDAAGQLVSTTTTDNKTTSYAESWANGFRYKTTTYPDASTRIEKYNADGSLAEVSGTAVHCQQYQYGVESGELYTKVILVGDEGATSQWQKTLYDMSGNAYKTVYSDNSSSQTFYDAVNRPVKQVSPSGVVNLTAYNSDGDVSASAVDMNRNDSIDYSGSDRVTGYAKAVTTRSSITVRRNTTSVYQDSSGNPTEASVNEVSADGLKSWQTSFGRTSSSQTVLDGDGQRTITVTNPDGSTVTSVYQDGRITSSTHSVLGETAYFYDAFNRVSSTTHTENGVEKTVEYAYNDAGQQVSVTENPGNRVTAFTYDDMGRRTSVTYPGSRTVNYTYAPTGEYLTVSGADTYPQAFTYDAQGRMKTLTTYKAYPGTPEVTTWNYDSARGFMVSKTYPDNKQVTYTSDADGKMLTRVWARGITTTYSYDNGGSMTGVSYSDGTTPAISYTIDRMGRVTGVTDASGSRTLSYNTDGTLANESIPYIVNGIVEYTYDSLGRRTGLQLTQNSTTVFANSYTYDSMSRLATVGDGTNTATYSRVAGTNLLNTTTIAQGGNTKLTTTRNYDSQNRLTSISSAAGAVTKTYSYTYDDKDRRSRLDLADGSYWLYSYDTKGQIISGAKYASGGAPIPGQSFSYNYDDIGNLTTEQRGMAEMEFSYTANLVNQYTQRLVPGIIPITGQASTDSTVSIWLKNHGENAAAVIKPTRNGEYFTSLINVDNTAANVSEDLEITAVKFDTTQDKDVVKTITGNYTVPKTPQLFSYDDDGDMTGDSVWNYSWNGENQLIAVVKTGKTKLEFKYDYIGRRTEKKVYNWVNSAWQLDKYLKFVYNQYKQIAEYDGTVDTMQKNYTWQPDVQDIPLWINNGTSVYYYIVDGNKNIQAMVDGTGALVAEYEYGSFGEILSQSGAMADINPFQFSSEYFDMETGLVYYNYRYYKPDFRRWLSQDPIEEGGGYNLYGFVGNNPISNIDMLGLDFIAIADRIVKWPYSAQHYSIQLWESCPFSPLNHSEGYTEAEIIKMATRDGSIPRKKDAVELKVSTGWQVWALKPKWLGSGKYWGTTNVWVARVRYGSDDPQRIMPIFDDKQDVVKQKWEQIIKNAKAYPWAEQTPANKNDITDTDIVNWPKSKYKTFQTNSNTFVRYIINQSGLTMTEMSGSHPGENTPSQNTEEDSVGNKYEFFNTQKPWRDEKAPPAPTSVP